jgi:hypothetical protein
MKTVYLAISLALVLFAGVAGAETGEKTIPRCQQLAQDYAQNPGSLNVDRLKQLQFCINQTLAQRKTTNPPSMLKGTIIEPLSSSETSTPSVPKNSDSKTP